MYFGMNLRRPISLLLRLDAWEDRDGLTELVALLERSPLGGGEGSVTLPVELGAYGIRFAGDDR